MNKAKKNFFTVRNLALIGLLAALVFVLSLIEIRIPLGLGDNTRLHLGNVMALLAGVLFGPLVGGLSAGFGSMIYDLINPLYISEFWITFLTKFALGWMAGFVYKTLSAGRLHEFPKTLISGIFGSGLYIILYGIKSAIMQHFVNGNAWAVVWPVVGGKVLISAVNGGIAVVATVLLAPILRRALAASGLFTNLLIHPRETPPKSAG